LLAERVAPLIPQDGPNFQASRPQLDLTAADPEAFLHQARWIVEAFAERVVPGVWASSATLGSFDANAAILSRAGADAAAFDGRLRELARGGGWVGGRS
jgi:hypothetical protein